MLIAAFAVKSSKPVSYIKSFNPTSAGFSLSKLYRKVCPTKTSPLIVVFEEVDGILAQIIRGIEPHRYADILVRTKSDWNLFMDEFDPVRCMSYKHVILLFTTNKRPD